MADSTRVTELLTVLGADDEARQRVQNAPDEAAVLAELSALGFPDVTVEDVRSHMLAEGELSEAELEAVGGGSYSFVSLDTLNGTGGYKSS